LPTKFPFSSTNNAANEVPVKGPFAMMETSDFTPDISQVSPQFGRGEKYLHK
jgi:hypothetical protein